MARSSKDQIKSALADGAELTETELLDAVVDVSDGRVLATIANMVSTGEIVAIVREATEDLPAASLYRLPGSSEADGPKSEEMAPALSEGEAEEPSDRTVDHVPDVAKKIGRPKKKPAPALSPSTPLDSARGKPLRGTGAEGAVVKQSFTTVPVSPSLAVDIALPIDRIAAMVPVEQFRAYLHCQALLCLSDPAAGIEGRSLSVVGSPERSRREGLLQARAYLDRLISTHQA